MSRQTLTITDWHPTMNPNRNSSRGSHWAVARKRHQVDRDMAWASARQANWEFVPGRVKMTITLVYPRTVRVDADNLVARCKGLIDGLKETSMPYIHTGRPNCCKRWRYGGTCQYLEKGNALERVVERPGYFTDDSTRYLDLQVTSRVEKGVKATEITLESLDDQPLAAGRSDAAEDREGK